MAQIEAGDADRGRWNRLSPVARIADEHEDGIRALMAVDGGESHLPQHDRSPIVRQTIPEPSVF
jgi:hypothetical protein